ncbi:phage tail protein [Microbacterium plantarum]|uniref:Tape measure protein n=1 Tax=Microbacterium plantarum TaxID=1816425 RepID=A0ABV5ESU1_9MICO
MSNVIGHATLNVLPSTKGFGSALDKEVGPMGKSSGLKLGGALGDAMGASLKLSMAAVGTTAGIALAKGFQRLEALDSAQAKLKGLGHSAESITAIMQSATAAVKGTAFGLGEASTAAAGFSAAGIPLESMQRSLSTLASTSAVAGSSMGDMGAIFQKVAATGKLSGEVVAQLSERGVPVLSMLSDQLGVTTADVSKMVSEGKISFDDFQNTMEAKLGPAAAAMGASFSGNLANVGASLGRLGAAAQKPIFDALLVTMPGVISLVDQFTGAVSPVAALIGDRLAPAAEALAGRLSAIQFGVTSEGASSFLAALGPLLPLLGLAAGALGPLLSGLPVVGTLFAGVTGPVGLLAGALIALLAFKPEQLIAGFDSLTTAIPGAISGIVTAASSMIPDVVARIATNLPAFVTGVLGIIAAAIPAVVGTIPVLVGAFATLIPQILATLLGAIPTILTGALTLFQSLVQAVVLVVPSLVVAIIGMLPQITMTLLGMLPSLIGAGLSLFSGLVESVIQALPILLHSVISMAEPIFASLMSLLPGLIESGLSLFLGLVMSIVQALPSIITTLVGILPRLVSTLVGMIPTLLTTGIELFLTLVKAILQALPEIIGVIITQVIPALVGALIDAVPELLQAGVDLIAGLVQGLWSAAGTVASALLDIIGGAVDGFLGFLGIKSPSRLFMGYGRNIGEGMSIGIDAMADTVEGSVMGLADAAAGAMAAVSPRMSLGVDTEGVRLADESLSGIGRGAHFSTTYNDYSTSTEDKRTKLSRAQTDLERKVAARAVLWRI